MGKNSYFLKKLLILSVLMSFMTYTLAGCGDNTKTFTMGSLSIDLPEDFEIDTSKGDTFDACARNDTVVFAALNETSAGTLNNLSISSLKSYAELTYGIRSVGDITIIDTLTERNNYYYFSYISNGSTGKKIYCLFEKNQNYWLCIFSCKSDDYSTEDILKWADTIEIN